MNLLYIVDRFPTYSETFIFDEIVNHIKAGCEVQVCVLSGPESSDFPIELCEGKLKTSTTFLGLSPYDGVFAKLKVLIKGGLAALLSGSAFRALALLKTGDLSLREILVGSVIAKKFGGEGIIHSHFGDIGRIGLAVARLARGRKSLFVTFHAYELTKSWFLPIERYYRGLFDSRSILLPISEHWRTTLIRAGADPNRTAIHRMGVRVPDDLEILRRSSGDDGVLRLIQVARMVDKKGHLTTIDALSRLKRNRPDIAFICDFVGGGPLQARIEGRVRELGLSSHIRFVGSMRHEDVLAAVEASDIFLLPSVTAPDGDMEGLPVALMEAMARSVPVISTYHSGIPELVEHGVSGLLTAEYDAEGLARSIEQLADDRDYRERLGAAGRQRIKQSFDQEKQGEVLRSRYREAVDADMFA